MKKVITACALFVSYAFAAAFSAYFTATSLSLNLMRGTHFWLILILVIIVALLAGACLTMFIEQICNRHNPSKGKLMLGLLGFLLFWGVSFTTNVHYFFVDKQGFEVLSRELASCKGYLVENTESENKRIDDQCRAVLSTLDSDIYNSTGDFERELYNPQTGRFGFSDRCIGYLTRIQQRLNCDSETYHDGNNYVIWDQDNDFVDRGTTNPQKCLTLKTKYLNRINAAKATKSAIIKKYFDNLKNSNALFKELIAECEELEVDQLPNVQRDGSVSAYYMYYEYQKGKLTSKMPSEYDDSCKKYKAVSEGEKQKVKFDGYKVYPSNRMFETKIVWEDIFHGYLPDYMAILQWVLISLIIDIVAFILFYLFVGFTRGTIKLF